MSGAVSLEKEEGRYGHLGELKLSYLMHNFMTSIIPMHTNMKREIYYENDFGYET